jgi:hypothetical protein
MNDAKHGFVRKVLYGHGPLIVPSFAAPARFLELNRIWPYVSGPRNCKQVLRMRIRPTTMSCSQGGRQWGADLTRDPELWGTEWESNRLRFTNFTAACKLIWTIKAVGERSDGHQLSTVQIQLYERPCDASRCSRPSASSLRAVARRKTMSATRKCSRLSDGWPREHLRSAVWWSIVGNRDAKDHNSRIAKACRQIVVVEYICISIARLVRHIAAREQFMRQRSCAKFRTVSRCTP